MLLRHCKYIKNANTMQWRGPQPASRRDVSCSDGRGAGQGPEQRWDSPLCHEGELDCFRRVSRKHEALVLRAFVGFGLFSCGDGGVEVHEIFMLHKRGENVEEVPPHVWPRYVCVTWSRETATPTHLHPYLSLLLQIREG